MVTSRRASARSSPRRSRGARSRARRLRSPRPAMSPARAPSRRRPSIRSAPAAAHQPEQAAADRGSGRGEGGGVPDELAAAEVETFGGDLGGRWRRAGGAHVAPMTIVLLPLHDHRGAVPEEALVDRDADLGARDLPAVGLAAELPGELADLGDRLRRDRFAEAAESRRSGSPARGRRAWSRRRSAASRPRRACTGRCSRTSRARAPTRGRRPRRRSRPRGRRRPARRRRPRSSPRNATVGAAIAAAESVAKFGISMMRARVARRHRRERRDAHRLGRVLAARSPCSVSTSAAPPSLVAQISSKRSGSDTIGEASTSSSVHELAVARVRVRDAVLRLFFTLTLREVAVGRAVERHAAASVEREVDRVGGAEQAEAQPVGIGPALARLRREEALRRAVGADHERDVADARRGCARARR